MPPKWFDSWAISVQFAVHSSILQSKAKHSVFIDWYSFTHVFLFRLSDTYKQLIVCPYFLHQLLSDQCLDFLDQADCLVNFHYIFTKQHYIICKLLFWKVIPLISILLFPYSTQQNRFFNNAENTFGDEPTTSPPYAHFYWWFLINKMWSLIWAVEFEHISDNTWKYHFPIPHLSNVFTTA